MEDPERSRKGGFDYSKRVVRERLTVLEKQKSNTILQSKKEQ